MFMAVVLIIVNDRLNTLAAGISIKERSVTGFLPKAFC
jgi:hypothetical protein